MFVLSLSIYSLLILLSPCAFFPSLFYSFALLSCHSLLFLNFFIFFCPLIFLFSHFLCLMSLHSFVPSLSCPIISLSSFFLFFLLFLFLCSLLSLLSTFSCPSFLPMYFLYILFPPLSLAFHLLLSVLTLHPLFSISSPPVPVLLQVTKAVAF